MSSFSKYCASSQAYASMSRIKSRHKLLTVITPINSFRNRFCTRYAKKIRFSHSLTNQLLKHEPISGSCLHKPIWKSWCITEFGNAIITQRKCVSMTHSSFQKYMRKIDHQYSDTTSVLYVTVHNDLRAKNKRNHCFIGIAHFCWLEVYNCFSEFFRDFISFHFLWTRLNDLFISNRNIRSQVLRCLVSSIAK